MSKKAFTFCLCNILYENIFLFHYFEIWFFKTEIFVFEVFFFTYSYLFIHFTKKWRHLDHYWFLYKQVFKTSLIDIPTFRIWKGRLTFNFRSVPMFFLNNHLKIKPSIIQSQRRLTLVRRLDENIIYTGFTGQGAYVCSGIDILVNKWRHSIRHLRDRTIFLPIPSTFDWPITWTHGDKLGHSWLIGH